MRGADAVNGANGASEPPPPAQESEPVEALLMAQRAKTPVVVAVAHDYESVVFKVPRPVVVLGWFWVVDAWTEPAESAPSSVVWKFRFEWCTGTQRTPWWSAKNDPERIPTPSVAGNEAAAWPVRGPGVSGPSTLLGAKEARAVREVAEDDEEPVDPAPYHCPTCSLYSDRVYESTPLCLNERCTDYFVNADTAERTSGPASNEPSRARAEERILPESLGLSLTPPDPRTALSELRRHDAGRDFWRAWVCKRCRRANERRDWFGFVCEACAFIEVPPRKIYNVDALRPPSRPVCTGPRPDEGYAQWPFASPKTVNVCEDDVQVISHGLDAGFGSDSVLSHALAHDGKGVNVIADAVLKGLQLQGEGEVKLRRQLLSAFSSRPAEQALSPFYTLLCGPEPVPYIAHFVSGPSVPWDTSAKVCLDAMELVNERAGRMLRGVE